MSRRLIPPPSGRHTASAAVDRRSLCRCHRRLRPILSHGRARCHAPRSRPRSGRSWLLSRAPAQEDALVAAFAGGKIEAYVGPTELGAADDLEQVIVDVHRRARTSLDIAVQELDSEPIAQAILDARWRGVSVNLFLEQDYLRSPLRGRRPTRPCRRPARRREDALRRDRSGATTTPSSPVNRRILAALLRSDVEVKGDFNPEIFHQKFILRDFQRRQGDEARQPGAALRVGELHDHRHAPEPEPRLRLPQRGRLPAVRDRVRARSASGRSAAGSTATCRSSSTSRACRSRCCSRRSTRPSSRS